MNRLLLTLVFSFSLTTLYCQDTITYLSDAIKENKHVGKAYSKSWEEKDPSQSWLLIETVSIPVPEDASGIYCATMA